MGVNVHAIVNNTLADNPVEVNLDNVNLAPNDEITLNAVLPNKLSSGQYKLVLFTQKGNLFLSHAFTLP